MEEYNENEIRDLKKLSRSEMLEIMLLQSQQIEKQKKEIAELTEKINDRTIKIDAAGTLAEASLLVNNVLVEADLAAKDYLFNIERMNEEVEQIAHRRLLGVRERADEIQAEAEARAARIVETAQKKADALILQAQNERNHSKQEAEAYWARVSARITTFQREYRKMQEAVNTFGEAFDK